MNRVGHVVHKLTNSVTVRSEKIVSAGRPAINYANIGSRTNVDVKAGKNIRVDNDGYENFSDYFSSPDSSTSSALSVSVGPPNTRRRSAPPSKLVDSIASMSSFTPVTTCTDSSSIPPSTGGTVSSVGRPSPPSTGAAGAPNGTVTGTEDSDERPTPSSTGCLNTRDSSHTEPSATTSSTAPSTVSSVAPSTDRLTSANADTSSPVVLEDNAVLNARTTTNPAAVAAGTTMHDSTTAKSSSATSAWLSESTASTDPMTVASSVSSDASAAAAMKGKRAKPPTAANSSLTAAAESLPTGTIVAPPEIVVKQTAVSKAVASSAAVITAANASIVVAPPGGGAGKVIPPSVYAKPAPVAATGIVTPDPPFGTRKKLRYSSPVPSHTNAVEPADVEDQQELVATNANSVESTAVPPSTTTTSVRPDIVPRSSTPTPVHIVASAVHCTTMPKTVPLTTTAITSTPTPAVPDPLIAGPTAVPEHRPTTHESVPPTTSAPNCPTVPKPINPIAGPVDRPTTPEPMNVAAALAVRRSTRSTSSSLSVSGLSRFGGAPMLTSTPSHTRPPAFYVAELETVAQPIDEELEVISFVKPLPSKSTISTTGLSRRQGKKSSSQLSRAGKVEETLESQQAEKTGNVDTQTNNGTAATSDTSSSKTSVRAEIGTDEASSKSTSSTSGSAIETGSNARRSEKSGATAAKSAALPDNTAAADVAGDAVDDVEIDTAPMAARATRRARNISKPSLTRSTRSSSVDKPVETVSLPKNGASETARHSKQTTSPIGTVAEQVAHGRLPSAMRDKPTVNTESQSTNTASVFDLQFDSDSSESNAAKNGAAKSGGVAGRQRQTSGSQNNTANKTTGAQRSRKASQKNSTKQTVVESAMEEDEQLAGEQQDLEMSVDEIPQEGLPEDGLPEEDQTLTADDVVVKGTTRGKQKLTRNKSSTAAVAQQSSSRDRHKQVVNANTEQEAESADSSQPSKPAVATDSSQPSKPAVATDSSQPSKPAVATDSSQPSKPAVATDSSQPSKPAVATDSSQPSKPAVATDSSQPSKPAVATDSSQPSKSAGATDSSQPSKSAGATDSSQPSKSAAANNEKSTKKSSKSSVGVSQTSTTQTTKEQKQLQSLDSRKPVVVLQRPLQTQSSTVTLSGKSYTVAESLIECLPGSDDGSLAPDSTDGATMPTSIDGATVPRSAETVSRVTMAPPSTERLSQDSVDILQSGKTSVRTRRRRTRLEWPRRSSAKRPMNSHKRKSPSDVEPDDSETQPSVDAETRTFHRKSKAALLSPEDDDHPRRNEIRRLSRSVKVAKLSLGVTQQDISLPAESTTMMLPRYSTSTPLHYFEMTNDETMMNTVKRREKRRAEKIIPPDETDENVRRSKRTRVKPLDWFRNERIRYEWNDSGLVVAGIESPAPPKKDGVVLKKVQAILRAEKRRVKKSQLPETPKNLSIHENLSNEYELSTDSQITVLNPDNNKEVLMECIKVSSQFNMVNCEGQPPTPNDPLVMCKPMRHQTFACGYLMIRPHQMKRNQCVRNDTMVFNVVRGKLELTIHQTRQIVESGDIFCVPVGNTYSLKNLRDDEAKLFFTQVKV